MRDDRNAFRTTASAQMSDAELSRRLGRCQTAESIGILLGALLVAAGCISAFLWHNVLLLSALVFVGVALILLLALPAQKKKKSLLQQQLGSYFRSEQERIFGAEPEMPELPIDGTFLKAAGLLSIPWTECDITDFHEGVHNDMRFSAANVELRRTVEERSGPNNDNWMTRSETLFRGIVVRCRDICAPSLDIVLRDRFQERKDDDITTPDLFQKHFSARTADGQPADGRVTPELRNLVHTLEAFANNGKVGGLILLSGSLTLALNTRYVFANVPDVLDLRDINGIRKWYTASLTGMAQLLDLLMTNPALTGETDKDVML